MAQVDPGALGHISVVLSFAPERLMGDGGAGSYGSREITHSITSEGFNKVEPFRSY